MGRRIDIVSYDPVWPEMFVAERERLLPIFESILESIHHVGSSSVPGLPAKPVIDILIVISDDSNLSDLNPTMIELGYTPRGECLDAGGTPGRFYYSKNTEGLRSHQVHVCKTGHFQIDEMIVFPRYLRDHPDVAEDYARIKYKAAEDHRYDIAGYIAAKDSFIKETIRKAAKSYRKG